MKKFFLGLAVFVFAAAGCSGPAPVPPTDLTFRGETFAILQDRNCQIYSRGRHDIAADTIKTMFIQSGATYASSEARQGRRVMVTVVPWNLLASVCTALVANGNEPYGVAGYSGISVAHVVIRITDASGAIRYFGEGRVEYRTSGRQNFTCGLREIRRTGGRRVDPDIRPCPSSPEQALQFAAADAFNSLKKY